MTQTDVYGTHSDQASGASLGTRGSRHQPLQRRLLMLVFVMIPLWATATARAEGVSESPHGGLARDCADCHSTEGWNTLREMVRFNHSETGWALESSHAGLECISCHQSLEFNHVPTACVDCHLDVHRGELGFGCESCHIPKTWENRREIWDRHDATLFPLTGSHASVDCAGCHREAPPFEYATTPIDCIGCHAFNYRNTSRPDHGGAGFPVECELCHTTIAWEPARIGDGIDFNHSAFPLTGAHRALGCSDCHSTGFAGTPTDCFACHRQEFEAVRDPNHVAAGFPRECQFCHSTNSWDGADFRQHDSLFFPIFSGRHRNEWSSCSQCHVNTTSFSVFSCLACHSRSEMNDEHDDVRGYVYNSGACYDCHPTGSE